MKTTKSPRLSDVARLAGVSTATASRALARPDLVAESTRKAVHEAAKACNYRTNLVARSLRTRRNHIILVLVPLIEDQFFPAIVRAVEERAQERGYATILGLKLKTDSQLEAYYTLMATNRVDGVIMLGGGSDVLFDAMPEFTLPLVEVLEQTYAGKHPGIVVDDAEVSRLAIGHLHGLGHRIIAHISGAEWSRVAQVRKQACLDELRVRGLELLDGHMHSGDFTIEGGMAAMTEILSHQVTPTAIYCANDNSALGALRICRQHSITVPGDISIIGVDDVIQAASADPPLTTVRLPRDEIGAAAADLLINHIERRADTIRDIKVPVELIVRQSTARPRA